MPVSLFSEPRRDLRLRTRQYATRIIRLYEALLRHCVNMMIGRPLFRSGTAAGAHVAEAVRAKSRADFTSKIDGAMQELEETTYWMELLPDVGVFQSAKARPLMDESSELMAIFVSMVKKTRGT